MASSNDAITPVNRRTPRANTFSRYKQEENHFTNALVSVLSQSRFHRPDFLHEFLATLLKLDGVGEMQRFFVLEGVKGTADAELSNEDCCVRFETKIASGNLSRVQIERHLEKLLQCPQRAKRLVMLTPDDSNSWYVEQFRSIDRDHIFHLGWKTVREFLEEFERREPAGLFVQLVQDLLDLIRAKVLERDCAGIIQKIAFGEKSEVYPDRYLAEFEAGGWKCWHTPRLYKGLDETGRKLLLYDRTRQGVTAEAEIAKVERTDEQKDYPWANAFAPGPVRIFRPAIPLSRIHAIEGLEHFGVHRGAYRIITHEQYRQLTGPAAARPQE